MKQFDPASIQSRFLADLATNADWAQIISDSAITSLGNATSEPLAEAVRYFEYLLNEAKWKRGQNLSSMITGATYLGYTPRRQQSSIGTLIVSHDPTLQQAGITNIFGVSDLLTFLTPYAGTHTSLAASTIFSLTDTSVQFISTQAVSYDPGDFYVSVPVIQGILRNFSTTAKGNPFEQIRINSSNVEAASNTISAPYFVVTVTPPGASTPINVTIVEDIFVADATEMACAVSSSTDYTSVILTFGNGVAGSLLPVNSTVSISYLETIGVEGNVDTNYTVTKILTPSVASQFYCSNIPSTSSNALSGILGGKDADTPDDIRGNAPVQYLINGAVVTTQAYKTAIENIPGVNTATVYSGTTVDPISGITTYSIIYSAVDTTGNAPDTVNFPPIVTAQLLGKNSPLDVVAYAPPLFLHLRLNIQATASTSDQANLSDLETTIEADLATRYSVLNQTFQQPFDESQVVKYVGTTYPVTNVKTTVEAIVDLLPSTFVPDTSFPGWYTAKFSFDRSFQQLKGFSAQHLHALKINVVFDCAECAFNGNSYSRTLFVVQDVNLNSSYTGTFTVNSPLANGLTSTIVVCGQTLVLTQASAASSVTLANAILTFGLNTPALSSNYTFEIPSPGVINIVPIGTVAPPSIFIPSTSSLAGVTVTFAPTVNWKMVQYPLITSITSDDYMKNVVLNPAVVPNEILPTDTTTPYIPFILSFDYSSLTPADLNAVPLGSGTLRIPTFLSGSTSINYINFGGASPTLLNEQIKIQVLAEPVNPNIVPYFQNNILKTVQDGIVDDIVAEVTNA